jgi:hypothetical protein
VRALVAAFAAAIALVAAELVVADRQTPVRVAGPCGVHALYPTSGVDGTTQRIVLDGLARAACRLGVTREQLVLSLAPTSGEHLRQPTPRVERALRRGLTDAIDGARHRGEISGIVAFLARQAVQHAPLDRLVQGKLF